MAGEKLRPIDRVLEVVYSLAAVPVLLGALFKITHKAPFGDPNTWLEVGLYTEAFVFLTFGIRYIFFPPEKVDELGNAVDDGNENGSFQSAGNNFAGNNGGIAVAASAGNVSTAPTQFFQGSNITPEAIDKLNEGFQSLENSLNKLNNASGSIVDTDEFATKLKEATASLNNLNTFYDKLSQASSAIADSADDAQKTQKEMAALAGNLEKLNQIYSGMITAMQGKTIH